MDLVSVLQYLYPTADLLKKVIVADEAKGDGQYIDKWDDSLGPQPTIQQLTDAFNSQGYQDYLTGLQTAQQRQAIKDQILDAMVDSVLNGDVPTDPVMAAAVNAVSAQVTTLQTTQQKLGVSKQGGALQS